MDTKENRALLKQHLAQAESDVVLGTGHVERQRQIIAELERDGHDTEEAEQLLRTFEETLALHVEGRDRLRQELASN
ncbi:MAG: hypothetical protein JOY67_11460 [Hyphomicrobiales bacterium]|nr:hypothetical protein [Hyphomicrobiales bacterium]